MKGAKFPAQQQSKTLIKIKRAFQIATAICSIQLYMYLDLVVDVLNIGKSNSLLWATRNRVH